MSQVSLPPLAPAKLTSSRALGCLVALLLIESFVATALGQPGRSKVEENRRAYLLRHMYNSDEFTRDDHEATPILIASATTDHHDSWSNQIGHYDRFGSSPKRGSERSFMFHLVKKLAELTADPMAGGPLDRILHSTLNVLLAVLRLAHNKARPSLRGSLDSMMGWVERSVEHLPNLPRLHPKECIKRSICEAHNEPDKYGAVGVMLRLLFPATNLNSTNQMDDMEYKVINKYRHAAGYGLSRRMEGEKSNLNTKTPVGSSGVCKEKYEDCLLSLLDVSQNLVRTFTA